MNICENNSNIISKLEIKVSQLREVEEIEYKEDVAKIESLRDDIKAVLLTLTNCVDTSKLGYSFGTVRKIDLRDFMHCLNDYTNDAATGIAHHKHFKKVFNEVAQELFGVKYTWVAPSEPFDSYKLFWNKENLYSYNKAYFKSLFIVFNCFWFLMLPFAFITLPMMLIYYLNGMVECKPEITFEKYKIDCVSDENMI